jgi:hypothetical protein
MIHQFYSTYFLIVKLDGLVKSRQNPSPSMGEGWGEGEKGSISTTYLPLPFIPSHKGRGIGTFYEFVKLKPSPKSEIGFMRTNLGFGAGDGP